MASDFPGMPNDVQIEVYISITDSSTGKDDYGYLVDSKNIAITLEVNGGAVSDIQIKATIFHETFYVMEVRYLELQRQRSTVPRLTLFVSGIVSG